ncbi:MAG TPA: hypothetical protein VMF66_01150 [Candidatus Acidoferrum sp.]|nr:hypothetical protein [Candidatus Acidoferrum sp.]
MRKAEPNHFPSALEAKEFLVSRIVAEAQHENVPLSEIERKMLYFSETAWTLPDIMEVNDEFDREYDQNGYEKKVAGLIRNAHKHDLSEGDEWRDLWSDAIRTLGKEDHYILVMVRQAGVRLPRPRGDLLKLWATGCAIVGSVLVFTLIDAKYNIEWGQLAWLIAVSLVLAYGLALIFVGSKRLNRLFVRVVDRIFGVPRTA